MARKQVEKISDNLSERNRPISGSSQASESSSGSACRKGGGRRRRLSSSRRRRGVLLLVVLAILVMFVLLVVTYSIIARHYRVAARISSQDERTGDRPRDELDRAFYQLLRDTTNPNSAIRGHSLLADLYGNDGIIHQPNREFPGTYAQGPAGTLIETFIEIVLELGDSHPDYSFYNGRLLTILDGPAAGATARIVNSESISQTEYQLRVMFLPEVTGVVVDLHDVVNPPFDAATRLLINGKPFNGTGIGYNPVEDDLSLKSPDGYRYALTPNPTQWKLAFEQITLGGVDESYDAPDINNSFLALVPEDTLEIKPSFHDHALINYWLSKDKESRPPLREFMLRPAVEDHPDFLYNNPNFQRPKLARQWDVDNTGDGRPDSVWLDLGFPTKVAADGQRYKPLFAIHCVDMDGRLNLNAHGTSAQVAMNVPVAEIIEEPLAGGFSTAVLRSNGKVGQGYGPPEIKLQTIFADISRYRNFLGGRTVPGTTRQVAGRYGGGSDWVVDDPQKRPNPGPEELLLITDTLVSDQRFADQPDNYWSPTASSAYGSPPDLHGEMAFGLNGFGQPVYSKIDVFRATTYNPTGNTNFDVDFSPFAARGTVGAAAKDALFSPAELESLLRYADADAGSLPTRIVDLAPELVQHRDRLTADSFDLPIPSTHYDYDILKMLKEAGLGIEINTEKNSQKLVARDLLMGLRMDVNRPFGNSHDDNGNLVVDEPSEIQSGLETLKWNQAVGFDHDNDGLGAADPDGQDRPRYHFAKQLYILLTKLVDGVRIDVDGDGEVTSRETAFLLAQWAVNVVDCRDPDAIMTPFEFDLNPLNGWLPDGDLNTDEGGEVVWGCERPELLITETLAFHDRRTTDEAADDHSIDEALDGAGSKVTQDGEIPKEEDDADFDQKFMPRDAFFVELYNPWNGDSRRPAELYEFPTGPNHNTGLLLDKTSTVGDSPIWRLLIVGTDEDLASNRASIFENGNPNGNFVDPDHPDSDKRLDDQYQERSVYFVSVAPGIGDGREFSTDVFNTGIPALLPGGYAVIGSSGQLDVSGDDPRYISYLGDRVDNDKTQTRRIELDPFNSMVEVLPPDQDVNFSEVVGRTDWPPAGHSVVTVPINLPRSLSVSDPVDGYDRTNFNGVHFVPPRDVPLDADPQLASEFRRTVMMQNGTIESFRVVHLQRLANPLQPHDKTLNPYRTIDSMTVNLKSFNGRSDLDPAAGNDEQGFTTLQRGDSTPNQHLLWSLEPTGITAADFPQKDTDPETETQTPFDDYLKHTLGFLNRRYGPPLPVNAVTPALTPLQPFPWLTWFNRPFVSQYELLQVPHSRSSRLLGDFTLAQPGGPYSGRFNQPFGHLLNFFAPIFDDTPDSAAWTSFHRIFEYLHVPSRFGGTTTELDASTFTFQSPGAGTEHFHPPFNFVSRYRVPGKVNVNTINSAVVFNAIFGSSSNDGQARFQDLVDSRRGYGGSGQLAPSSNYPTFVANPFRSFAAQKLVPLSSMQQPVGKDEYEVTATVLRPNAESTYPLFSSRPTQDHNNAIRNSYFYYEGVQRLGNLVTTRSNVYAIWITVGYFEVDRATDKEGKTRDRLGKEIGLDTNEIRRRRAFYMVDRSIPVAFEPGQNHNVDRAVLIRRFIE